jgi:hypothetical protein
MIGSLNCVHTWIAVYFSLYDNLIGIERGISSMGYPRVEDFYFETDLTLGATFEVL